jgi:hypothetical protein
VERREGVGIRLKIYIFPHFYIKLFYYVLVVEISSCPYGLKKRKKKKRSQLICYMYVNRPNSSIMINSCPYGLKKRKKKKGASSFVTCM